MSFLDNYQPPSVADLQAAVDRILAMPRTAPRVWVDDSGFERGDENLGHCEDDDEMADRQADREWAARWPA